MKTVTSTWGGEPAPQQPISSPWAMPPGHARIEDVPLPAFDVAPVAPLSAGLSASFGPGPAPDADPCLAPLPFPAPSRPTGESASSNAAVPDAEAAPAPDAAPAPPADRPVTLAQSADRPVTPAPTWDTVATNARQALPVADPAPPAANPVPAPAPAADDHEGTWLYAEESAQDRIFALDAWLTAPIPRRRTARVTVPGSRRPRQQKVPRRPGIGLTTLVLLSLVAAFFAWVSVEPLWLAIGHGDRGTATVTTCTGKGVAQRCVGEFTASDGGFTVAKVSMLGVGEEARQSGTAVTARMVSSDGRSAYVGSRLALHLRWMIGLVIVFACGLGIALATGAARLDGRRARFRAFSMSLGGPLLIMIGFLAMTF